MIAQSTTFILALFAGLGAFFAKQTAQRELCKLLNNPTPPSRQRLKDYLLAPHHRWFFWKTVWPFIAFQLCFEVVCVAALMWALFAYPNDFMTPDDFRGTAFMLTIAAVVYLAMRGYEIYSLFLACLGRFIWSDDSSDSSESSE